MRIRLVGGRLDGYEAWVPGVPHSVQIPGQLWLSYSRRSVNLRDRVIEYRPRSGLLRFGRPS